LIASSPASGVDQDKTTDDSSSSTITVG
jgi:hypothetical protein